MAIIIQTVDGVIVNRFEIGRDGLRFGRAAGNHVQIDDAAVSNHHAEITLEQHDHGRETYRIRDIGSTNGTYLNEAKVNSKRLHHKDIIRVGWNNFIFIDENQRDFEKTDKITKSWIPGLYFTEKQ